MAFNTNIRITFLPRAKALIGALAMSDQNPRRFGMSSHVGDLVRFPGVKAEFQVVQRLWTYGEASETLEVMLDLAGEPPLTVAP